MSLSKTLIRLRRAAGLTQKELALQLKCQQPYISQMESNDVGISGLLAKRLIIIAKKYGMTLTASDLQKQD